jgi:hypothetical protein
MTINIEGTNYPLYLSFATLPLGYFLNSQEKETPIERLAAVSNIPLESLTKLSFDSLGQLFECYGYIDSIELLGAEIEPYDIGSDEWGKYEQAKLLVKDEKNAYKMAVSIAHAYTGKPYVTLPCMEVWQEVISYLKGFAEFNKKYERLGEWQPTAEQQMAGIDRFEKFGMMPQLYGLRKYYPSLTDDEILELKADVVYFKFMYDFEQAQFEKALQEIQAKKK